MSKTKESEAKESKPQSGGARVVVRQLVLFAILGVCLAAAAYEFLYARAESAATYEKICEFGERKRDLDEPSTDADIHKLVDFPPVRVKPDQSTAIDYYRWSSVVPFRKPYEVWVLYKLGNDGRWMHFSQGLNTTPELISDEPPAPIVQPDAPPAFPGGAPIGPMPLPGQR